MSARINPHTHGLSDGRFNPHPAVKRDAIRIGLDGNRSMVLKDSTITGRQHEFVTLIANRIIENQQVLTIGHRLQSRHR